MINENKILANIKFLPRDMCGEIYRYLYPENFPEDEETFWQNRWRDRFAENFRVIRTIEPTNALAINGFRYIALWWYYPNHGWGCVRATPCSAFYEINLFLNN